MVGIDWVAVAILAAAYIFSQIRAVPLAARHWVFAVACFLIAGLRLRSGATTGMNLVVLAIAVGLGLFYAVKGIRAMGHKP